MSESHYIVVSTFLVNSKSSENYIKYLISLDLHRRYRNKLVNDSDDRYVEVESLQVYVHYSSFCPISYTVTFGRGYRLPRILYDDNA